MNLDRNPQARSDVGFALAKQGRSITGDGTYAISRQEVYITWVQLKFWPMSAIWFSARLPCARGTMKQVSLLPRCR